MALSLLPSSLSSARLPFLFQVNASRADCGNVEGTYYQRDAWDRRLAQCLYRKCAPACPTFQEQEKREIFSRPEINFAGDSEVGEDLFWKRTTYCCTENLCNGCAKLRKQAGYLVSLCLALWVYR